MVEFAFVAILLLGIALSGIELSRYVLLNFKLSRAAATASDLAGRAETLSDDDVTLIFFAMNRVQNSSTARAVMTARLAWSA